MEPVDGGIRVVLVDDENLVRAGLRLILDGDPLIEIVGEAGDGAAALDVIRESRPDVVLMDVRMPTMDGLAATRELLAEDPGLRILVLTTFDTDDLVLRALELGASGFLLKDTPPARLVEAVHHVAGGGTMLSPEAIGHLVTAATAYRSRAEADTEAVRRMTLLTERERGIATAVARGLSNADIAEDLHIGITTVKTHVGRVLDKLGAENRVQIALLVHDAGRGLSSSPRPQPPVPPRHP
ncbi:MAG: response regulator transcription factor [Micrococcaceae bacterium]|nr:response regulator transcription factor [Micrococcaceae bacterium]MDN5823565.1 response regulator transcription factor [Micrococcaceae bacterium]MDN5905755.1 response regulator transcription factor [Micrococcaceae bacterium]